MSEKKEQGGKRKLERKTGKSGGHPIDRPPENLATVGSGANPDIGVNKLPNRGRKSMGKEPAHLWGDARRGRCSVREARIIQL